uniref:DEK-C domain-containing protein n=1 Tax=Noccaea caerulescens TaxID=107243 RepID=A0A1J3HL66_NOCCA
MSGDSKTSAMEIADKIDSNDGQAADIESQILATMRSRATYLREKSDSLTLESVRRLLEEDMKLEKHALDVHKSFVKQHLVECLEGVENDGTSETSQETEKKDDATTPVKEAAKLSQEHKAEKDAKEETTGDDEKRKDSPVMGLLTEENTSKSVAEESKQVLQSEIKKALRKKSSYIKANSEKITMGILRRLLEQDLKLEKYSLDTHKKFISEELEEVLQVPDATKPSTESKRKNLAKKVKSSSAKKLDSEDEMSESDGEDEEEEDDDKEVAVKKKTALSKSEGTGKRKREKEKVASAKKTKQADSESDSDEGNNVSSSEKPVKKQQPATPVYGKRVEKLKAVIKSCGMSVPPSVYKKAKQAPEKKREDTLIKELEEILAKEGLSSSPSEKEIKEVKKRKQITKELEGIDTSNIVSSSRRRSSASFVPPPKPKIVEESESDESEDSENEEDDEEEAEAEGEGEGEGEEEDEDEEGEVEEQQGGGNEDSGEESETEKEPNT